MEFPGTGEWSLMGISVRGRRNWKSAFCTNAEPWQETADPAAGALNLKEARSRLRDGLQNFQKLALNREKPAPCGVRAAPAEPQWFLLLENEEPEGTALRPHLPLMKAWKLPEWQFKRLQLRCRRFSYLLISIPWQSLTIRPSWIAWQGNSTCRNMWEIIYLICTELYALSLAQRRSRLFGIRGFSNSCPQPLLLVRLFKISKKPHKRQKGSISIVISDYHRFRALIKAASISFDPLF